MSQQLRSWASDPMAFFADTPCRTADGVRRLGDVWLPFYRDWYTLITPMLIAVASGKPPEKSGLFISATKGTGKTPLAARCIAWLLAFSPRSTLQQAGAVDKDNAAQIRNDIQELLTLPSPVRELLKKRIEITNWAITGLPTGSTCDIVAADVHGSHGHKLDALWLDELHAITKTEFVENLLDNHSKSTNGICCITTNAGFVPSFASDQRDIARESSDWEYREHCEPAPWIPEAKIVEAKRRNSPTRFARLWLGEWTSASGDAFDEADIDAVFAGDLEPMTGHEPGWTFCGGLDLSVRRDHSAFVVIAKNQDGRYRVARAWLWKPVGGKIDLASVEDAIRAAHRQYRLSAIGCDPYQCEYILQRLQAENIPIEHRHQTGRALVEQAAVVIEQINSRNLISYPFEPLERDLRQLRVEEKSYGMRLVSPRSEGEGHGDTVTAASIALAVAKDAGPAFYSMGPREFTSREREKTIDDLADRYRTLL